MIKPPSKKGGRLGSVLERIKDMQRKIEACVKSRDC